MTVSLYLALGAAAWSAWVVSVFVRKELAASAGPTERLVFFAGKSLTWAGAVVVGGALAGLAASVVWKAVGP